MVIQYTLLHLPELCTCPSHQNKVFLERPDTLNALSLRHGLEQIIRWNAQLPCWKYVINGTQQP